MVCTVHNQTPWTYHSVTNSSLGKLFCVKRPGPLNRGAILTEPIESRPGLAALSTTCDEGASRDVLVELLEASDVATSEPDVATSEPETADTTFGVLVVREDFTWLDVTLPTVTFFTDDALFVSHKLLNEEDDEAVFDMLLSEQGALSLFTSGSTCPLTWTSASPSMDEVPMSSAVTVSKWTNVSTEWATSNMALATCSP